VNEASSVAEPAVTRVPPSVKWYRIILVAIPLWLAVSAVGALWYYFHLERRAALERQAAFAREISISSLADDLRKFTGLIGERHSGADAPAYNLTRTAAMIEGLLGPANTGLDVRRLRGPAEWPIIETHIPAVRTDADSIWVITGYDSPPGSRGGQFNASGVAALLAAIQAAAADTPDRHLRFLFLPHWHADAELAAATLSLAAEAMQVRGRPAALFWVEAMGAGPTLVLSARNSESLPVAQLEELGEIAAGGQFTIPATEADVVPPWLPDALVRVSTRAPAIAGEVDDAIPSPTITADAAGKLLEFLRRMSAAGG
jgi:hypothetical protein